MVKLRTAVIGLGNPGNNYRFTRHNAGFLTVDRLSEKLGINMKRALFSDYILGKGVYREGEVFLVKPLTYMNLSGKTIAALMNKFRLDIAELIIICDNMDLYPGVIRLKKGGGTAGHNGIRSIIEYAGTADFFRFYIGIGRPECPEKVTEHVLGEPAGAENKSFHDSICLAAEYILQIIDSSPEKVMNEVNRIKNIPANQIS